MIFFFKNCNFVEECIFTKTFRFLKLFFFFFFFFFFCFLFFVFVFFFFGLIISFGALVCKLGNKNVFLTLCHFLVDFFRFSNFLYLQKMGIFNFS